MGGGTDFPYEIIREKLNKRERFDTIIILSDMMISDGYSDMRNNRSSVNQLMAEFKNEVNPDIKLISI